MSEATPEASGASPTSAAGRPWYLRVGPGLITACVVIGPGSILTSSKVGAGNGFSMLWIVVVAVFFMMMYMTAGARLGVQAGKPPGDLIRERVGSWLSILVGISVFFISAAFQSGNNIGLASAFEGYTDSWPIVAGVIVLFNALAISFLFAFQNVYRALEKLMMCFVALMLICFALNLLALKPDFGALLSGFIPTSDAFRGESGGFNIDILGLVGTTFVITAAYYQAYLVRQKGWGQEELRDGLIDARIGSVIMALITIMLMSTAAAGLHGKEGVTLTKPHEVAVALEAGFGSSGKAIFCIGIFCAAYSSFLVNSMIGGFILADSLNLGSRPTDRWPKLLTTLVLLTGMAIGLAVVIKDFDRTPTIIAAQAVTVVASPLVAGVLIWLVSRDDILGPNKAGPAMKAVLGLGFILLLGMSYRTAFKSLPGQWERWQQSRQAAVVWSPPEVVKS